MYYCQRCAKKAGIECEWKTYSACDSCGFRGLVLDHCDVYKLPANAPCLRGKKPVKPQRKQDADWEQEAQRLKSLTEARRAQRARSKKRALSHEVDCKAA